MKTESLQEYAKRRYKDETKWDYIAIIILSLITIIGVIVYTIGG